MKFLAVLILICSWSLAQADVWLSCKIAGQADTAGTISDVPQTVHLDGGTRWAFRADKKALKEFSVSSGPYGPEVSYQQGEAGDIYKYVFKFDERDCEEKENGFAILTKSLESSSKPGRGSESLTSVYDCECGYYE
jgi:hypothetical protein